MQIFDAIEIASAIPRFFLTEKTCRNSLMTPLSPHYGWYGTGSHAQRMINTREEIRKNGGKPTKTTIIH